MAYCGNCGTQIPEGAKFCPNCGSSTDSFNSQNSVTSKSNPSCPHCGTEILEGDVFCWKCGKGLANESASHNPEEITNDSGQQQIQIVEHHTSNKTEEEKENEQKPPISTTPKKDAVTPDTPNDKKGSNWGLILILSLLFLLLMGVGGYFYYDMVYLPQKIDREAPRYYTMANMVVLRSSRSAGADFNKMASLPYGTELITYAHDSEWCKVKVNSPNCDNDKKEGFVATPFVLNKQDFFLLNSIFGNQDSREVVITSKCRIALLNYFKANKLIGKIDEKERIDAGIKTVPNSTNQWQIVCLPKDVKPNSVLFKRLYNRSSQFTDFAIIINNIVSGERKLLYFYFDDDETPHLLTELPAPEQGYIKDIYYISDRQSSEHTLKVFYSE